MARPDYCPCENESPDPCPACGATVEGNDAVSGVCQARLSGPFCPDSPDLEAAMTDAEVRDLACRLGEALREVLSADPDMPSYERAMKEAEEVLAEAERAGVVPPPF